MRAFPAVLGLWFLCLSLAIPTDARGQTALGGSVIIRIPDGTQSRCINGSSDQITLYLVSMVTQKHDTIFSETTSAGLFVETVIEGATAESDRKVTIPRSFMINIDEYDADLVRVPVEQKLLSRFRLRNGDNFYSNATFRIKFVSSRSDGPLKVALASLADVTKRLPIPPNPFVSGVDYFIELSNNVIGDIMSESDNPDDIVPEAQLAFEFSHDGQCSGLRETTGVKAVVKQFNEIRRENSATIDLAKIESYCFRYRTDTHRRIEFTTKSEDGCEQATGFRPLMNPHYVFVLNAVPVVVPNSALTRQTGIKFGSYDPARTGDKMVDDADLQEAWNAWVTANPDLPVASPEVYASMKDYSGFYSDLPRDSDQWILAGQLPDYSSYGGTEIYAMNSDIGQKYASDLGMADKIPNQSDGAVLDWKLTGAQAAGQDIFDAVARCKLVGLSVEDCL